MSDAPERIYLWKNGYHETRISSAPMKSHETRDFVRVDGDCGDCRKPIVDSCKCSEHLRICEEQQRAERFEEIAASAIGALQRWESWAIRLQNSVAAPSPLEQSQEVAARFSAILKGDD